MVNGTGPHEGRVEVYRSGEWVTVCDDTWDIKDAAVVCRQLGYPTALVAVPFAGFGEGTTNNIWLDDIGCTGSELNLTDCSSSTYGWSRGCTHDEDAGVVCSGGTIVLYISLQLMAPANCLNVASFLFMKFGQFRSQSLL